MAGTISSLGIASGTLTQNVLDQLRAADESSMITPITRKISATTAQSNALKQIDTWMSDLSTAAYDLRDKLLFTGRSATVSGDGISVETANNTDIQSFSLEVVKLASKQVSESGSFTSKTDPIASASGTLTLSVAGTDFLINYDTATTLDDLKKQINTVAGDAVNASIVQLSSGDYRLFLSSKETGLNQTISMSHSGGLGTQLTSGLTSVQDGADAQFKYNGIDVSRSSNTITDLVAGATITLKTEGSVSNVDIAQNRDAITEKLKAFVEKYNTAAGGIAKLTHNSTNPSEAGVLNSDSTIKSLLKDLRTMVAGSSGGHSLIDYGITLNKSGVMSLDETVFNKQMDASTSNVEAFFAGGDYLNSDASTTTLSGFFNDLNTRMESYTKFNGLLDTYKQTLTDRLTQLNENKDSAIKRLDDKYLTMSKQFAAYDAMISKINQQGTFLTQLISAANKTNN